MGFEDLDTIRDLIRTQGITQAVIGEELGLTQVQVSKSLGGTRRFTVREMDKLRVLLGAGLSSREPSLRVLPVIGMTAAGNWREAIQQTRDFMPAFDHNTPRNAYYLDVEGDSMDLIVPDGGRVLVDPDDKSLFPGRLYVIQNSEGETTFKKFLADPARLAPCSTNDSHREIPMGGEPFLVVGRVIWSAARH